MLLRFAKAGPIAETRQLSRGLVLRDGLQILERAGEGIGQAPHGPWLELLMHGLKVQVMHSPCQVLGKARFLLDEGLVDEQLGRSRRTTAATAKPPPAASAARSSFASGPHQ